LNLFDSVDIKRLPKKLASATRLRFRNSATARFLKGTFKARTSKSLDLFSIFCLPLSRVRKSMRLEAPFRIRAERKTTLLRGLNDPRGVEAPSGVEFERRPEGPPLHRRQVPIVENEWKFCGMPRLTGFFAAQYVGRVSRTVRFLFESARTEFAPLRRNADSVFENLVERASRERADSGASPKRSHKMGHGIFARGFTWSPAHRFERWSWQPAFYPSAGDQVSNESLILAQNQRWRRA
jgi:hypothetical protein